MVVRTDFAQKLHWLGQLYYVSLLQESLRLESTEAYDTKTKSGSKLKVEDDRWYLFVLHWAESNLLNWLTDWIRIKVNWMS